MQTSLKDQIKHVAKLMQSASKEDYIILNDIASSLVALRFLETAKQKTKKQ